MISSSKEMILLKLHKILTYKDMLGNCFITILFIYRKTSKETRGYQYLLQATNEGIIRKSLNETCQN